MSRRPAHRSGWFPTLVTAGGLALLLLLVELLLATLLIHPHWVASSPWLIDRLRDVYLREDWSVLQGDGERIRYDSELLYLLRPGQSRFANREFSITLEANSAGLRDDERSLDGPEIIVLGDSYALGWGVEQDESFPEQLEAETGLVVLNAAMSSYGTGRETLLLERLDTSRARAVVVQYFLNDFAENRLFAASDSPPAAMREADFRSWLARLERQQRYRPLDYLRAALARAPFHPELDDAAPDQIAGACLDLLARSEELRGLPILFLQVDPWTVPQDNILPELRRLLATEPAYAELGDRLTPVELAAVLEPGDFFLLDPHLRPSGHRKIALRLAEELGRLGLAGETTTRHGA